MAERKDDGTRRAGMFGDEQHGGHEDGREGRHEDSSTACDGVSRRTVATDAKGVPFDGITPTGRVLLEEFGPALTTKQAGDVLHRHQSHVRALCQAGELPAVRIGSRWHVGAVKLGAMLDGDEGRAW